jgi:hypothetical protein
MTQTVSWRKAVWRSRRVKRKLEPGVPESQGAILSGTGNGLEPGLPRTMRAMTMMNLLTVDDGRAARRMRMTLRMADPHPIPEMTLLPAVNASRKCWESWWTFWFGRCFQ